MSDTYAQWLTEIDRNYGTLENYLATDGDTYNGDTMAAYQQWLMGEWADTPVTLTPVAQHWHPSSGCYAQSLVFDETGRAYGVLYRMGHPEGDLGPQFWDEVAWSEGYGVTLTFQRTETTPPEWFDDCMFEGALEGQPRVAHDGGLLLVIARENGTYDFYAEGTL